jgi:phosphate transport system ATP-binding protein
LWEEVKDRLEASALGLSGGQNAAPVHRPGNRQPTGSPPDGRACSALDPIATAKVEELIYALKRDYTIVIVTHKCSKPDGVSDHTAFFYLGKLIEFDKTEKLFTNPSHAQTEEYITGRFG